MTTPSLPSDYQRFSKALPALKGIAILAIVAYHAWGRSKGWPAFEEIIAAHSGKGLKSAIEGFLEILCFTGENAVGIFIVASGFGLTVSWWLRDRPQTNPNQLIPLRNFWQRRLFRLFPLYWLWNGIGLLLWQINPKWVGQPYLLEQGGLAAVSVILASLTTIRNLILRPEYYWFLTGVWWYVGLAVQLYLVFPFLLLLGNRKGWSFLLFSSFAITLVYRILAEVLPFNDLETELLLKGAIFPARLLEFVFGMVLAIALIEAQPLKPEIGKFANFYQTTKNLVFNPRFMLLNLMLWGIGSGLHWAPDRWAFLRIPSDPMMTLGELGLLFQLVCFLPKLSNWFIPLGAYSYGIYLSHDFILRIFQSNFYKLINSYWLRIGLFVAISCLFGMAVEWGYNYLNQRVFKNKAA